MNMPDVALPEEFLFPAAGSAAGSLVLPVIGLVATWILKRRSLPLRHAVLLATLGVVALLPVLIPWLQSRGCGWDIHSQHPDTLQTTASIPPTMRQGVDYSSSLELPRDGSLESEGMTVAEVMARYGGSATPEGPTSTTPALNLESAIEVRRLIIPTTTLLCLAWLVGSCLSLFHALQAGHLLREMTRRAEPIHEPLIVELLALCSRDAGLGRPSRLVGSADATVPYVSGLLRPTIILPASLVSADQSTLRAILLHELAHVRRRDLWVGVLQRLAAAMYWWNPLVHRLNTRLAEFREDLCDNYVLAHTSDPRGYAQSLVELASQAAASRIVPSMGLFNRSPNRLTGRIQRILQEDRPMATRLGGVSKVLLVVFVFALGCGSTLFVFRLPDILPEHGAAAPADSEGQALAVESPAEPMISLVRNDGVAVSEAHESNNWEVAVFPPIAPAEQAADSRAYAADDQFVPAGNTLLPTVPDVAPSDAFADQPAPIGPEPSPTDFSAPPSAVDLPVESLTTGPAIEEPRPTGNDPFSSAPGLILPEPSRGADTLPPLNSVAEPAPPPKALVLVELTANADGSVKQLRYLTEDLGNDDAAFAKLEQQIVAWAGQYSGGDLTVQIVADPQLRYEHVARVTKLCSPLVTRVVLAQSETKEQVTITVGFVRDPQGRPVVATPVVFWQDEVVRLGELRARLELWTAQFAVPTPAVGPSGRPLGELKDYTVVVRCDSNVDYKVIETIMQDARQAGFEHFTIKSIETAEVSESRLSGVVTEVDQENLFVQISIGVGDGLRPGQQLRVLRAPEGASLRESGWFTTLEVVHVDANSARCRIRSSSGAPIRVGDVVRSSVPTVEDPTPISDSATPSLRGSD